MSAFTEKLWSSYQSWFERDAPLRRGLIATLGASLEALRESLKSVSRQRFYLLADTPSSSGSFLDRQLRGPWRVLYIDPAVSKRVYTIYRASSGDIGLSYKDSAGAVVMPPRVAFSGPGIYRLPAQQNAAGPKVWVLVGSVGLGVTEPFSVIQARHHDHLRDALDDRGWKTTQSTVPSEWPLSWTDIRQRLKHFMSGTRGNRTTLLQALRMVEPLAQLETHREDWTSRFYAGFGYVGHFYSKASPLVAPTRSYWTTIWKTKSHEACRLIVRVPGRSLGSQELRLVLDQYLHDGIVADIVPFLPTPPPPR